MIDNFTKYTYQRAVKITKSEVTTKALQEFIEIFGCPVRIISDQETAFSGEPFEIFCRESDIQHVRNATACPRANGSSREAK